MNATIHFSFTKGSLVKLSSSQAAPQTLNYPNEKALQPASEATPCQSHAVCQQNGYLQCILLECHKNVIDLWLQETMQWRSIINNCQNARHFHYFVKSAPQSNAATIGIAYSKLADYIFQTAPNILHFLFCFAVLHVRLQQVADLEIPSVAIYIVRGATLLGFLTEENWRQAGVEVNTHLAAGRGESLVNRIRLLSATQVKQVKYKVVNHATKFPNIRQ